MDTFFKIELAMSETEREESFPMQEQAAGPLRCGTEKPVAVIFAERLAEAGSGVAAPVFVP